MDVVFGHLGVTCFGCRPPQGAATEMDVMSDVRCGVGGILTSFSAALAEGRRLTGRGSEGGELRANPGAAA